MNRLLTKAIIMSNDIDKTQRNSSQDNFQIKRQRKRSVFHLEQIQQLEYVFIKITHYPDLSLRQQLTLITQLPDKKIQIWFQNRRAKWRKQNQLGHFGGLHEITVDEQMNFVPAPKSNFIVPSTIFANNVSIDQQQQQLAYLFYMALQTALPFKG